MDLKFLPALIQNLEALNPENETIGGNHVASGYVVDGFVQEINLGIDPESIILDGAGFVDTYNQYASEELIQVEYMIILIWKFTHIQVQDYEGDGNVPLISYTSLQTQLVVYVHSIW